MAYWLLFFRLIVRPVLRERARSFLIVSAVALGVSVVLAIDLAGNAAAGSFRSSMETLAGDNDLEVTAVGGVPEQIVGHLARLPSPLRVTARIEDHATVLWTGETVPLIGIDVIAEVNRQQVRNLEIEADRDSSQQINDPNAIWTTRHIANRVGETIALLVNDQKRNYVVRGFIPQSAEVSEDVVMMDIAAAQSATGKVGRVDRILLKVPDNPALNGD